MNFIIWNDCSLHNWKVEKNQRLVVEMRKIDWGKLSVNCGQVLTSFSVNAQMNSCRIRWRRKEGETKGLLTIHSLRANNKNPSNNRKHKGKLLFRGKTEDRAQQLIWIQRQSGLLADFLGGTVNYSSCPYKAVITVGPRRSGSASLAKLLLANLGVSIVLYRNRSRSPEEQRRSRINKDHRMTSPD